MNLKPTHDFILVQEEKPKEVTSTGLLLPPDKLDDKSYNSGVVIKTGPGSYEHGMFVPTTVNVGDKAIFAKFSGTKITINEIDYLLIRNKDVMAIVEPDPIPVDNVDVAQSAAVETVTPTQA